MNIKFIDRVLSYPVDRQTRAQRQKNIASSVDVTCKIVVNFQLYELLT